MRRSTLKLGQLVTVADWKELKGPDTGTVIQIGTRKARVLFPIRKFVWLPIASLTIFKEAQ